MKELLRIRDVRIALLARAASQGGDAMTLTALSLLVATTGRPLDLTVLLVAFAVPVVALSGYAGRLVDRQDSRRVLVGAGLLQVVGSLALLGPTSLPWQVGCILLVQSGQAVLAPAWGALLPHLVGEERVGRAAGLQQSLASLAWMAGPALGGLLFGVGGFHLVVVVDTVTFAGVVTAALLVRTHRRPGAVRGPAPAGEPAEALEPSSDRRSGLRLVAADPVVLALVIGLGLFVLALEGANVVESFLVVDALGASPTAYGLLGLALGAGVVVGSVLAGRIEGSERRLRVIAGSAALMGLTLGGAGLAPAYWVLPPLFLLAGAGNGLINALNFTVLIGRTPESARGRVLATVLGLTRGCSVLALVLGGVGGQLLGPRVTFVVGGALAVLVSPLILRAVRYADAPVVEPAAVVVESVAEVVEPAAEVIEPAAAAGGPAAVVVESAAVGGGPGERAPGPVADPRSGATSV